ncbi:MAG TPA: Wadjet anti-phage system protein JetD domain-containing protein [Caulobacteraceae bacterium]|nr:Wadjet anti-phage system protein JetD domain-containing protein [Caulobacteraceae bacterium]
MSRRRFADARGLLADLLDRYEANPAAERLLAYLDVDGFISVVDLDACLSELAVIERAGGVIVRRRRAGGADHVESVRLGDVGAVYRHLGRVPAGEKADQALAQLEQRGSKSQALRAVIDQVRAAWSRNVSALGLGPGEAARLIMAIDLAEALIARLRADDLTQSDFRSFSRAVVGDSKRLERLAPAVASLAQRLAPDAIVPEMQAPEEIIGAFGITRLPQPFLISGPLALDGLELPTLPYLGLPPEQVPRVTFARPPTYLLIVENFTSFIRHAREVNPNLTGAVIFSGGFPSRPTLRGIVHIARLALTQAYHWGDIDLGGLRIFIHLERALAEMDLTLKPHLMTEGLLRTHGLPARRRSWARALAPDENSGIRSLWQAIADANLDLDLEQEGVAPQHPPSPEPAPSDVGDRIATLS